MSYKMQIPSRLKPLFDPKPIKVIYGGRSGAKSMTVADIILMRVMTEGIKVAGMREHMNSVNDSVHALLVSEIERLELSGFTIQNNCIYHESGGSIIYRGLARNPESIKSAHDFDLFWVEEAASLSKRSIDLLIPTLRKEGSELWTTFNPNSSSDPIYQEFIKPFEKELIRDKEYFDDLYTIIKINYDDNPFHPKGLDNLRLKHKETKSLADYEHIWLGECADEIENGLIQPIWFDSAIDSHEKLGFKPQGALVASHDPSDLGEDAKGYALRYGSVILDVREMTTGDVNIGCDWALDLSINANVDHFIYDGDGLGIALKRQIDQALAGKKIESHIFKGSQSPENPNEIYEGTENSDLRKEKTNKQTFKNKRAQYYFRLAERFRKTYLAVEKGQYIDPDELISLSSNIDNLAGLRAELCKIPIKPNPNGYIQLLPKPEMKKLGIQSPNRADCLAMSMLNPVPPIAVLDINFDSEF